MDSEKRKRRFRFFVPLVILLFGYFSFLLVSQQVHLSELSEDQAAADSRLAVAQQENAALREEKERLKDPAYIEKIAREDLGMTRQGELPYTSADK